VRGRLVRTAACLAALALAGCAQVAPLPQESQSAAQQAPGPVSWAEIKALPVPPPDHRLAYGEHPLQFGELRLPAGPGPHPVAVLLHGGCWRAEYDLEYMSHMGAALARAGVAVWTPEYRRVGDEGGGWPGTFQDAAGALARLDQLAQDYPLDLERVVLVGHSAGGHLALWLAARHNLPVADTLHVPGPLRIRGVVSLAGITDLARYAEGGRGCNAAVPLLMGGSPAEQPERYAAANPIELLPLEVPVRLLQGALDPIVKLEQASAFAERAGAYGEDVRIELIEGAGHFDLVAPYAPAWSAVQAAVLEVLAAD
jgi:acetyl esterase/lipase